MRKKKGDVSNIKGFVSKIVHSVYEQTVHTQKVEMLYDHLLISTLANFLGAALVYISSNVVDFNPLLLVWFSGVSIVTVLRIISLYLYRKKKITPQFSLPIFFLGVMASAFFWGFCVSSLIPANDLLGQMLIIIIIAGVTAGSVQSLQSIFWINLFHQMTILIPLIVWLLLQRERAYFILSAAISIYFAFIVITAWRSYSFLNHSLKLRFENRDLTKNLTTINRKTKTMIGELKQHEVELEYVNAMNEMLQSCREGEEAYVIIEHTAEELFPLLSGALYKFDSGTQEMERIVKWGRDSQIFKQTFKLEECWAMREGRNFCVENPKNNIVCKHFETQPLTSYICIPQITSGGTMGLLMLMAPKDENIDLYQGLATRFNDALKLSLANMRLLSTLNEQSMHDSLTQLYNRRYLEDILPRELRRLEREETVLCVCMIDIDDLKTINDTYGHDVGDDVLKFLANILQQSVRGTDIVSRYGGDEFIMVLIDSDTKRALPRLQKMVEKIQSTPISLRNLPSTSISVSIGLAGAPLHGSNIEDVIHAADQALHQAKHKRTNKVVVFGE